MSIGPVLVGEGVFDDSKPPK